MRWGRASMRRSPSVTGRHSAARPATTSATLTTPGTSSDIWWADHVVPPGTLCWPMTGPGSWSSPGSWSPSRCVEWSGAGGGGTPSATWGCRETAKGRITNWFYLKLLKLLFRETFHFLNLSSKDFTNNTMIFPSVLNTDALLPDWNKIIYERETTGIQNLKIINWWYHKTVFFGSVKEPKEC